MWRGTWCCVEGQRGAKIPNRSPTATDAHRGWTGDAIQNAFYRLPFELSTNVGERLAVRRAKRGSRPHSVIRDGRRFPLERQWQWMRGGRGRGCSACVGMRCPDPARHKAMQVIGLTGRRVHPLERWVAPGRLPSPIPLRIWAMDCSIGVPTALKSVPRILELFWEMKQITESLTYVKCVHMVGR